VQAGALHLGQHASEAIDDAFLVLLDDLEAAAGDGQAGDDQKHDDDDECCDHADHLSPRTRLVRITGGGTQGVGRNNRRSEIASQ
jgi:hypothetical protein